MVGNPNHGKDGKFSSGNDRHKGSPYNNISPKKLTKNQLKAELDYTGPMKGVRRAALRKRKDELEI